MVISKKLLDDLDERRAAALASGDSRAKGLMTARERLLGLYAQDTFLEFGLHASGDGVIAGTGYVDGRPVAGFSQDFSVAGGALGKAHAAKICEIMDHAGRAGVPVVGFHDSDGARMEEGVETLSGYGRIFSRHVDLSGVVPQIAVVAGPCIGTAACAPALMDLVIMTRSHSRLFVCAPDVIESVTGEATSEDEIGGADAHASVSGMAHLVAEDDDHALILLRRLLSFLPSNNHADPPHRIPDALTCTQDAGMDDLVPDSSSQSMDVRKVMGRLVDDGDFLELQADFAANLVIALARIDGCVVGLLANQSMVKGGTLDMNASDKGARFIGFCDSFNIPLVSLVDVPGFLPGVEQEKGGIARHGARMLFANGAASVPRITVVLRKAYGGAFLAMGSRQTGADVVLAWPTADIGLMGAEGSPSPYLNDGVATVTDVIEPSRTRVAVALALRGLLSKRKSGPPRKHGNIPL
jgi:propionyl-CoA carboxylase beta chain